MSNPSALILQGLQIVWINVLLSGDNAVVIALACRGLPPGRRRWAIGIGSLAAVALRILFTIFIVALLGLPYVKLGGGLLLLWIALRLLRQEDEGKAIAASPSIWGAVRTITLADAIMSLDNVVAVAAAARNSLPLIAFGIAVSVPLIVFGSTLMLTVLKRFPLLVVAGAALLGWVAGEMIAADAAVALRLAALPVPHAASWLAGGAALAICDVAAVLRLVRAVRGRRLRLAAMAPTTPADVRVSSG